METLNRNNISYQEMDGLIELAEKVSENIENLKNEINSKRTQILLHSFLSLFGTVFLILTGSNFLYSNENIFFLSFWVLLILILYSFLRAYNLFKQINLNKLTINREEKVLQKLLNMIEGYKDLYVEDEYGNVSPIISKALIEMRLSRINFGVK